MPRSGAEEFYSHADGAEYADAREVDGWRNAGAWLGTWCAVAADLENFASGNRGVADGLGV